MSRKGKRSERGILITHHFQLITQHSLLITSVSSRMLLFSALADADTATGTQAQLAVGDNRFTRLKALRNDCLLARRALHFDVAQLNRLVILDDENVATLLAGLHRRRRY